MLRDTSTGDAARLPVAPMTAKQRFDELSKRLYVMCKTGGPYLRVAMMRGEEEFWLDMWVDAGIDAINPIEYRLGMDPVKLCEQYGSRLVCVGGLCNTEILPRGDRAELRDHVQHLFEAARGGGFIMGTASITGDVSVATFEYLVGLLDELDPYR